jgi:glycosyltransferase involved in cell wall biosynthesis
MKNILITLILLIGIETNAQTILTREGQTYTNSDGNWFGVNIPRSVPTIFSFKNNSITSVNTYGYMLQAGDESPLLTNNKLDGAVITGNKFIWNGTITPSIITHGLFNGYNINSVVRYNYLNKVPYGIIFKSGTDAGVNMTFTSGGAAYNIVKNGHFAFRMKGINGVKIYNNTIYSDDGNSWYLIYITENMDRTIGAPSLGARIFNNIFYTKFKIPNIAIKSECLTDFQSDYNVYWCEEGDNSPVFAIDKVTKTWAQWQALGYDKHSVVINPNFINTTAFVPAKRLNFGVDLGPIWQSGLSTTAVWGITDPQTTEQNGIWQVGAVIYEGTTGMEVSPDLNDKQNISIYPNPARKFINVSKLEKYSGHQNIGIIDLMGTICLDVWLNPGINNQQIPINLKPGLYIVQTRAGSLIRSVQKLIIVE